MPRMFSDALGCFLMPSQGKIKLMQKILDDFAIGSLNYGKKRITMPVEQGGLVFLILRTFSVANKSAGF